MLQLAVAIWLAVGMWLAWLWLSRPVPAEVPVTDPHAMTVTEFARDLSDWDRRGRP